MLVSLDIVVPCFNEEKNLPALFSSYVEFKNKQFGKYDVNLLIVDNGSTDGTSKIVKHFIDSESSCRLLILSRNFGKESSLTAGLLESKSDLVVPIDADLQDPIEVISEMLDTWEKNDVDVVLGKRISRVGDSRARRLYSYAYGKVFANLSDIVMPADVGEFRLMTRKVILAFSELPESQRFVRGLFAWMGFKTATVEFNRKSRDNGTSRFSYKRLFNLAIDGIVSFSIKPLRLSIGLGLTVAIISSTLSLVVIFQKLFHKVSVPGYASIAFLILFLGGVQLFAIGILGEYIGKVLLEAKRRPNFLVSERYPSDENRRL